MAEVPEGVVILEWPVIWNAPFLPYAEARAAFMEHAHECETCEPVVHDTGNEQPEEVDLFDLLCQTGSTLARLTEAVIDAQHSQSMQN
jgi:hypothetical protein